MPPSIHGMSMEAGGRRLALIALALVVVVAACGDDGGSESIEAIVFGEGVIPESVPDDFPIPANAVVGTTLVDKINNRTEFRLTLQADITATIQFFQVGLVNKGYVVDSSDGTAAEWTLRFSDGTLTGTVFITSPSPEISAAVVSVNTS